MGVWHGAWHFGLALYVWGTWAATRYCCYLNIKLQWGSEYRTLKFRKHSKTRHFSVWQSNVPIVSIIHRVLLRFGAVHSKHWSKFFCLEIKPVTSVLVQILKTYFLLNFAANFFVFLFFLFFSTKSIQIKILTSVLSAQHPNAGQNMQQLLLSIQI